MYEITECTRCGKPLKTFRLGVFLSLQTDRLKDTGLWENVPNLTQTSDEYLCEDCFKIFANTLTGALNIKHSDQKGQSCSCKEPSVKESDCGCQPKGPVPNSEPEKKNYTKTAPRPDEETLSLKEGEKSYFV